MGLLSSQLQLVAITSLSFPTKFCELNKHILHIDLMWLCEHKYTSDEHHAMEVHVLQILNFSIYTCTPISGIKTQILVNCWKNKLRGHLGKKLRRNREIVYNEVRARVTRVRCLKRPH